MKKLSFYFFYVLFVLFLFEFAFRAYYAFSFKNAKIMYRPFAIIEHYYPGFLSFYDAEIPEDDQTINVLLLGGSVLTSRFGDVPSVFNEALAHQSGKKYRIFNLATPAHTSRDSRLKYHLLKDKHFDVVFIYHGINETRFNHCPKEVFKDDYSHVDFYAKVNSIAKHSWSAYTVLPLVYIQLKTNILKTYAEEKYMPFHSPVKDKHKEWLPLGMDVKTKKVFRENYLAIFNQAKKSNAVVIMPTFLFYIPNDYSLEAFEKGGLDYSRHRSAVEIWGTVETVSAGINAHNRVIKELADSLQLPTVFTNQLMPKNRANFDDLCHFTKEGSLNFGQIMIPLIVESTVKSDFK